MALKNLLIFLGLISLIFILTILGLYIYNFAYLGLSSEQEVWAQFGDFMGGTLNPILAFFAFIALLYTIKLQSNALKISKDELTASRKELEKSRIAQEEQSKSLELQNQATNQQIFENTFFKLLDLLNGIKSNMTYEKIKSKASYSEGRLVPVSETMVLFSSDTIDMLLNHLKKDFKSDYNKFNKKFESKTGAYFGQIYQIIKFVENSNIENKQRYLNIFRAQFSKKELDLLFYHCLGEIGKRKFKKLIEKYEFFEHIAYTDSIKKQILEYNKNVFGKNEDILNIYNELNQL